MKNCVNINYKHFVSVIASQLSWSPLQRSWRWSQPQTASSAMLSLSLSLSLSLPHQNLICNFPTKPSSHCTALIFTSPEIPAMTVTGLRDGSRTLTNILSLYPILYIIYGFQELSVAWCSCWRCALKVKYLIWLLQRPCDGEMTWQWDAG